MSSSLFTKIINGDIPSYKIYEDDLTYAFLDIHPVQPGHVLVIPKVEVEFVWDLQPDMYIALMNAVKQIALQMRNVLDVPYVHSRIVGTDVPHAHVHLIPFLDSQQLRNQPDALKEPDHKSLSLIASRLAF